MTGSSDDHESEQPAVPAAGPGLPSGVSPLGWPEDAGCLTPGQVAELAREEWELCCPDPDDPRYIEDPEEGPPEWLPYSAAEHARLLAGDDQRAQGSVVEAFDAGFTHSAGGNGSGFSAGGPLDVMLPGSDLGWHVVQERRRGLGTLADDQLIGLLCANRRQKSLNEAIEADLVAELDRRRTTSDGSPGEHVDQELAAALTLTGWSADALLSLARDLARLPKTRSLLGAGLIDIRRAGIIARHTAVLSDADAARAEDLILPRAAALTTGELNSACRRAVIKVDPQAARKRKDKALKDARVEAWFEAAGTAALAGRDLAPEQMILADKSLDDAAHWLKTRGVDGTHQQLRAMAFGCFLARQPLESLLPEPAATGTSSTSASASDPDTTSTGADAPASTGPGALGGTVHLTMPFDTWADRSDNPGEIGGYGAADADTCRDIARHMAAAGPAARWCITLVDRHGRPAGHGCARAGPGPPGTTADPASWLATVTIHPIETGTCAHQRESAGYQPSPTLRHIVKTRSPRCGYPGCRRPAAGCDDDHTIAYHLGGRTCECNLYPLCRRHHQCKQAPGWHLDQPRPGRLIWTSPSGRTYTKITELYPV